jgi:hypothetical protein
MDVVASLTSRGMLLDWTAGVTEFFFQTFVRIVTFMFLRRRL